MRSVLSISASLWLALFGATALAAGHEYVPPPSGGGGGVSGDGTGITDAGAFRTALSLGTAATASTGTSSGNVPVLTTGGLPAVGGGNLTGIASSQVSGLGTAAAANTGTSSGNVPVLGMGGALPAIDGSNLTGLLSSQVSGLGTASSLASSAVAQTANNLSDLASASTARTNLGLGTAATADTGTSSGNVPVLGMGGSLPAVDGSNLTGLLSSQISGLGTASASSTSDFVAASGFYSPDVWTYTWTPADGDPIATGGWTAVQSAATAYEPTAYGTPCYTVTPSGASGESLIYKNVGAASASSWEARVLLWFPGGNTSRFGWMYDSGIGSTDALYKVTLSGTTAALRINETTPTVPATQYYGRWVVWTLRCYYNVSTTQSCELYAGRMRLTAFESATAETAVSAGRLSIGRVLGAIVTAGCMGGVWVRSTGVNESPVEYRERARTF